MLVICDQKIACSFNILHCITWDRKAPLFFFVGAGGVSVNVRPNKLSI